MFFLFCYPRRHGKSRALHEGEAAFEHSCRLLRQQCEHNIQASNIRSLPSLLTGWPSCGACFCPTDCRDNPPPEAS